MDVKKRILFLVPSMRGGGSERVISMLVNNLDRRKFDISLVLLKKEGVYLKDIYSDITIIDLKTNKARFAILKIRNLILKIKPDVVFSTLSHLNLVLSIIKPSLPKKIKFIARESSIASINNLQGKYPKLFNFLYKKFYNNFDLIISQSYYMKNDLIKNFSIKENKIKVINNPVDILKINVLSQTNEILFNKNNKNIIAVGRLDKEKGFDLLIKTFAKLPHNYYLYFIGEGKEKNHLMEIAKKYNLSSRVYFIGFQSNPYKYMRQADLLILSSLYEGFPNVVLEANACGTPVVAFNCPGGTKEIIENGVNGFLVECKNIDKLAKSINKAIDYNWDREKIRNLIKKKYSLDNVIKHYENILLK